MQWIIPTFPNNLTRDISTVRVIPNAGESAYSFKIVSRVYSIRPAALFELIFELKAHTAAITET